MVTQLRLQFIRMLLSWKSLLFLFLFPLVIIMGLYPFLSVAVSGSQVPIAWVDDDNSEFSQLVYHRLQENDRLHIKTLNKEEARQQVQTGEVEAAFLIKAGFEEQLKTGETDEIISWIRSNSSTLDAFAKEKIASEAVRLLLNSKAAQFVAARQGNESWEKTYKLADSHWMPAPLFQMEFKWKMGVNTEGDAALPLSLQGVISFLLVYVMGMAAYFYNQWFKDKRSGVLERIKLSTGHVYYYYGAAFLIQLVLLISVTCFVFGLLVRVFQVEWGILTPWMLQFTVILTLVHAILFLMVLILRSPQVYFSISAGIILASFLLGGIPLETLDGLRVGAWLPHGWLFNQNWMEGFM
ncbi:ABC transporter permease [Thalassobacillus devorans]|uniref:ABC transporter permease n=1 Tax=Thalassobacillus devorans TaxID=279813 RepID=UPI00048D4E25|nr:ABC transporter permease [Thalassobacillus devorans]